MDPAAQANRVWATAELHGRVVHVPKSDAELRILDADECYELLKSQQIGRSGVNAEHYPLIFPVNYR